MLNVFNIVGVGKSTLLKLLRGDIQPTSGEVVRNRFLRLARFDQHSADQFDVELTPVEHLRVRQETRDTFNKLIPTLPPLFFIILEKL
jgi:ATP-binding cassette subfamily F protein 2